MKARFLVVCIGAVAMGVGVAGPAAAGDPTSFKIAKHAGGPYTDDGVRLNVAEGEKRSAYLKVRGINGEETVHLLEFFTSTAGYTSKYYKDDGTNITAAVKGSGYEFQAKPDRSKRFRVKVKRAEVSDDQGCILPRLNELDLIQGVVIGLNADPSSCALP